MNVRYRNGFDLGAIVRDGGGQFLGDRKNHTKLNNNVRQRVFIVG